MVDFTFDGKPYTFTSGSDALSYARTNTDWQYDFAKHTKFIKAYEEAAFRERNPEGYTVSDPRKKTTRFVTPEEAYSASAPVGVDRGVPFPDGDLGVVPQPQPIGIDTGVPFPSGDLGLVTQPTPKTSAIKQNGQTVYVVTYIADMREKTRTFPTQESAIAFRDSLHLKFVRDQGWKGTVDEYNRHVKEQRKIVSFLIVENTIEVKNGVAYLIKPTTVLSNEEIIALKKIGFTKLEFTPIGPTYATTKWITDTIPDVQNDQISMKIRDEIREQTLNRVASLGSFMGAISSAYQFLMGFIPGEQPGETPWRTITTSTLKYVDDVGEQEQLKLDISGRQAEAWGSALVSLPIGVGVKAVGQFASRIASSVSQTTGWGKMFANEALKLKGVARTVALKAGATRLGQSLGSVALKVDPRKIATFLRKHPKAQQMMMYATMGLVGPDVVQTESGQLQIRAHVAEVWRRAQDRIDRGEKIDQVLDDIIREEGLRLTRMAGGIIGFKAGYTMFDKPVMDELIRLESVKEIDGKARGKFSIHRIPKELRDLFKTETNPITGDEIIIGLSDQGGQMLAVGRKYGIALKDLFEGKAIDLASAKGAFLKHFSEADLAFLMDKGLVIDQMSAPEILQLAYKELNLGTNPDWTAGSPWGSILERFDWREIGVPGSEVNINVLGTISEAVPDEGILGSTKAIDTYNGFVSSGIDRGTALILTQEVMMENNPFIVLKIASEGGYSEMGTQLVNSSLAMGASSGGSAMSQVLQQSGLTTAEVSSVISIVVQPTNVEAIAGALPILGLEALGIVLPEMDSPTLEKALLKLEPTQLIRIGVILDNQTVRNIIPHLGVLDTTNLVRSLKIPVFIDVIPHVDIQTFESIIKDLSKEQTIAMVDLIPDLSFDQVVSLLPALDQTQLTETLQAMDYPLSTVLDYIDSIPDPKRRRWFNRLKKRFKDAKTPKRTSRLEPYKVTFHAPSVKDEKRRVMARSFREALINAQKIRKRRVVPLQVKVEKLVSRLRSR